MKKVFLTIFIVALFTQPVQLYAQSFTPLTGGSNSGNFVDTTLKTVAAGAATCLTMKGVEKLTNSASKVLGQVGKAVLKGVANYFSFGAAGGILDGTSVQKVEDSEVRTKLDSIYNKESCWDGIATNLAQQALQQLTNKTVAWVNTGLDGNPVYVRDLNSFLYSSRNERLRTLLPQIQENESIFGGTIRGVLTRQITSANTPIPTTIKTTPEAIEYSEFMNDFTQGGWSAMLDTKNNPMSALFRSVNNVAGQLANQQQNTREEVSRNDGFLDIKECVEYKNEGRVGNGGTGEPECIRYATTTPGTVVVRQLESVLGSTQRQLENVDEINEIVYMFFYNVLNKIFSKNCSNSSTGSCSSGLFHLGSGLTDPMGGSTMGTNVIFDAKGNPILSDNALGDMNLQKGVPTIDISRPQQLRAIITMQNDFIAATKDVLVVGADLAAELAQLDYCMPGPNPMWAEQADVGSIASNFDSMIETNADNWKFYNQKLFSTDEITMDEAWLKVGNLFTTAFIGGFPATEKTSKQQFNLNFAGLVPSTVQPTIVIQMPAEKERFEGTWGKIFGALLVPGGNFLLPPIGALKAERFPYDVIPRISNRGREVSRIVSNEQRVSSATIPFFFATKRLTQQEFEGWLRTSLNSLGTELYETYDREKIVTAFGQTGANQLEQILSRGTATSAYKETANLVSFFEGYEETSVEYNEIISNVEGLVNELQMIHQEAQQIVKVAKARYIRERANIGDPVDIACIDAAYTINETPVGPSARSERANIQDNAKIKRVENARAYFEKAALMDINRSTGTRGPTDGTGGRDREDGNGDGRGRN